MPFDGNIKIQRIKAQENFRKRIENFDINAPRVCRICNETKQSKDFYSKISKTYYGGKNFRIRTECKKCTRDAINKRFRENYHHNCEKRKKEYRQKHRFTNIKTQYGINKNQYFILISKTNGICPICNRKIRKFQIDHCHTSGKVRGILCFQCNLGLGNFNDNIQRLKNAIKYLSKNNKGEKNDTQIRETQRS